MAPEGRNAVKARDPLARELSHALVTAALTSSLLMAAIPAKAAGQSESNVTQVIRQADDSESVQFVLTLKLRNQDQLKRELKDIYNPKSVHYHKFLSTSDFASKYAPSKEDYAKLESFATQHGLTISGEHSSRTMIEVTANTATIRDLFKSQMYRRQTKEGKDYLAPDIDPTPPSDLSGIGGSVAALSQKPIKTSLVRPDIEPAVALPTNPSYTGGNYTPSQIRTLYGLNGIQNGGQPVALVELSSANYADAAVYASQYGLHNPTLTQIAVDGGTMSTGDEVEVMLDIEMVMAVSNPANIYIYTAPHTNAGALADYAQIADDNLVSQASTSYVPCEADIDQSMANQENAVFSQMAAEGIAMFAASGDHGAGGCDSSVNAVSDPASQPYVTGVGGTSLQTTPETVWYDAAPPNTGNYNNYWGSGGGVSTFWPIPDYQTEISPQSSQFSTTMRNVPDVALDADPKTGYYIYCTGCEPSGGASWTTVGGTSAAAPEWAAFWSLIGKGLTVSGAPPARAGFANPALYAIAANSTNYALDFHDVTTGNNGYFNAVSGYDNATGLGSFNGGNLYQAVIARKRATTIAPIISYLLLRNTGN